VRHAKPDPDLFLAADDLVGDDVRNSFVIGDSTWDLLAARRAGTLGIGLLAGGYGRDEFEHAVLTVSTPTPPTCSAPERGRRSAQPGLDRHMNNIQIPGAQD
jgi:beta-phosphoglucomutase-like phosphatase (HAD superfamily)